MKPLHTLLLHAALSVDRKEALPAVPQISYREAKALLAYGDAQLLRAPLDAAQFALGRWLLGHYFAIQHQRHRARWAEWLQGQWADLSSQAVAVWMDFARRIPWSHVAVYPSALPDFLPDA